MISRPPAPPSACGASTTDVGLDIADALRAQLTTNGNTIGFAMPGG